MTRIVPKIERFIFYLFVFSFPFQTRLIFAKWAMPFNEWLAAFLYPSDILMGLLFIFWLVSVVKNREKPSFSRSDKVLMLFFLSSIISLSQTRFMAVSVYQLAKLAEFLMLYFYLKYYAFKLFNFNKVLLVLVGSGFFQSIIAIIQYSKQSALGLRWLGESPIIAGGKGVASFVADSGIYLRSYGTLPHPNILAGFLLLVIYAFYFLYFTKKNFHFITGAIVYAPILLAFFFTFSRIIIGIWFLAIVSWLAMAIWKKFKGDFSIPSGRLREILFLTIFTISVFAVFNWPQVVSRATISADDEAVSLRLFYIKSADKTISLHPYLGTGIGTFVPNLTRTIRHVPDYLYQPVHNVFLLIFSEEGLLGFGLFLGFLAFCIKEVVKRKISLYPPHAITVLLVSFLVIGLFDHFLWTIQQGRIMFWAVLALAGFYRLGDGDLV